MDGIEENNVGTHVKTDKLSAKICTSNLPNDTQMSI
jgi:hypothetical protein